MTDHAEHAAQIEANVGAVQLKLDNWARHMAARYCGPVYLVGSTLHHPHPRDCDIRIVIRDDDFAARYGMALHQTDFPEHHPFHRDRGIVSARIVRWGEEGPTQLWVDDCAKFNGAMSREARLNMDIKVWPESYWREPYPAPIVLAAPSPRWFVYNAYHPAPAALTTTDGVAGAAGEGPAR